MLPAATVLILNGRLIEAVCIPDEIPADHLPQESVDLRGRFVIPGLINTHVHIQMVNPTLLLTFNDLGRIRRCKEEQIEKNMTDCIRRGVTTIRDGLSEDLQANRLLKTLIKSRTLPGPRIVQAVNVTPDLGSFAPRHNLFSQFFYTSMGFPPLDYKHPDSGVVAFRRDASLQTVRDAVDIALDERGADCIKIYDQREKKMSYRPGAVIMSQKQLDAVVNQARKRGVKTTMHHVTAESFQRGIRAGIDGLVHLPFDELLTEQDLKEFQNTTTIIEPTLTLATYYDWIFKGNKWKDHPEQRRLTEFRNRIKEDLADSFWLPELLSSFEEGLEKCSKQRLKAFAVMDMSHIYRYFSGIITNGMENLRMMADRCGLTRIACGNDSGAASAVPAAVGHELDMLEFCFERENSAGLCPKEVLKIATINSARVLGMADQLGSIQAEKIADLVVLDKNPLLDAKVIGGPVRAVYKEGELIYNRQEADSKTID